MTKDDWKIDERAAFTEAGLQVTAIDLSQEMVARCRSKGIDAQVMNSADLDFAPEHFDAAYSMNCLLHVPDAELNAVLRGIRTVLRPGGLFYLRLRGGEDHEGPLPDDSHFQSLTLRRAPA